MSVSTWTELVSVSTWIVKVSVSTWTVKVRAASHQAPCHSPYGGPHIPKVRACRLANSVAAPVMYQPETSPKSSAAAAAAPRAASAIARPKWCTAAAYSGPPGHSPRAPGGGTMPGSPSSAAHLPCAQGGRVGARQSICMRAGRCGAAAKHATSPKVGSKARAHVLDGAVGPGCTQQRSKR